jgi:sugar diacid utilization regulator
VLTIRSLVADGALQLRVLVAGHPGALDAEVVWVHNTELLDPSPYLRQRELVLTNGLWHDGAESSAAFVANVVRAGGSGIVFGLREQTPTTPPDLVAACQDAELPLLEISPAVPFTAVSRAVATAYAERRQRTLLRTVRRGDALAEAISGGSGAVGVLRVLRRDYDLPLAVVDRTGRLLGAEGVELTGDQLRTVAACLTRHPPPLEADLGDAGRVTIVLVRALGEVDAGLVCLRPARDLGSAEREALEQAARFLSLEVAKHQAVRAIETRFATELLDMVLSGAQRAAEVPGRLRAFGIDANDPLAVLAFGFAGDGSDREPATLPGMAEVAEDFFVTAGSQVVVAAGSQDVVAVLPWRRSAAGLTELAGDLAATLDQRFGGQTTVVGVGGVATDASRLRKPLVAAREACRVLRGRRGGVRVAALDDLSTHRLLLGLHDRETLRRFADGVLGPMREYDRRRGGDLETSLRVFLDQDGQWAATARALYIHVNTLRSRLARVAELTGLDATRTADRVDLFLALEADAMARDG